MLSKFVSPRILAPLVLACTAACGAQANMIVNGSFETGDFSGWTTQAAPSGSFFGVDKDGDNGARFGLHAAVFGAVGGIEDRISQTLATTPGGAYHLSFWIQTVPPIGDGALTAYLNGQAIDDAMESPDFFTQYDYYFLASSSMTELSFGGFTKDGWFELDNVSVEAKSGETVPEPASLALVGIALAAAAWITRRRAPR